MLTKIATSKPHLFIIKDNGKMIGRLSTLKTGAYFFYTDEPFRKLNAFGINEELLYHPDISFEIVFVFCKGIGYYSYKENIIKNGIKRTFSFGTKIFLPIPLWIMDRQHEKQLSFDFCEDNNG